MTIRIAATVLALACAGACPSAWSQASNQTAPEKTSINIATASVGITYLPLVLADRLGYFKQEGLDVTISTFAGGSKALQALLGNSSDFVSGAYSNTITMAAKGQIITCIAVQARYSGLSLGISKKRMPSYKSFADLKGMKIGVSAPGSSTHMFLAHLLSKGGLNSSDVAVIGVSTGSGAVAAFQSGQLDALSDNEPVMSKLEDAGDLKIVATTRNKAGNDAAYGAPFPEASILTKQAFIKTNPRTVQAVTNAIVRAERWLQKATPEQVAEAVPPDQLMGDRALYISAFQRTREALSLDGRMSADGARVVYDVLGAFTPEVKATPIDLSKTYDNRFVDAALKRYP